MQVKREELVKREPVKQERVKEERVKPEPVKTPTAAEKRDAYIAAQPSGTDEEDEVTGDEGEGEEEERPRSAYRWRRSDAGREEEERPRPARVLPWPYDTPKCPGGYHPNKHSCSAGGCKIKTKCLKRPCIWESMDRHCQGCHEASPEEYSDDLP
jgi:hypothetical protein